MPERWTIIRSGRATALDRAGVRSCVLTRQSSGEETLSLQMASDATPFFRDEVVTIQRNAANWFTGKVAAASRDYTGSTSRMDVTICGPWVEFSERTFVCSWKNGDGSQNVPRGFIGLGGDAATRANAMNVGEWLEEVAERVRQLGRDQYAGQSQFMIGEINAPVETPTLKIADSSFAEAWQKIAEFVPELVTWFDHSSTVPLLYVNRAGNLPAVNLALGENRYDGRRGNLQSIKVARTRIAPAGVCVVLRKQTERATEDGGTVFDTTWREIKFPSNIEAGWRNVLTFTADESQDEESGRWDFPSDLARQYFRHLTAQAWQGTATWKGDGVLDALNPGRCLNIANAENPDFAEMRGVIYSATHDVLNGVSTVSFGPPDTLGFESFRQWLAWQRRRRAGLDADKHHIDEMTEGTTDEETYGFGDDERPRKIGYARREIGWCENNVAMVGTFLVKDARLAV